LIHTRTQCEVQTLLTSAGPKLRAVLVLPPVNGIYDLIQTRHSHRVRSLDRYVVKTGNVVFV